MDSKAWWKSKTLWFNILAMVEILFQPSGALGHVLAPQEIGAIVTGGNVLLRMFTSSPISGTPAAK